MGKELNSYLWLKIKNQPYLGENHFWTHISIPVLSMWPDGIVIFGCWKTVATAPKHGAVDMKITKFEKSRPKCNIVIRFGFQCQVFINEMISKETSN